MLIEFSWALSGTTQSQDENRLGQYWIFAERCPGKRQNLFSLLLLIFQFANFCLRHKKILCDRNSRKPFTVLASSQSLGCHFLKLFSGLLISGSPCFSQAWYWIMIEPEKFFVFVDGCILEQVDFLGVFFSISAVQPWSGFQFFVPLRNAWDFIRSPKTQKNKYFFFNSQKCEFIVFKFFKKFMNYVWCWYFEQWYR